MPEQNIDKVDNGNGKPKGVVNDIIDIATKHPDLTLGEVAKLAGCSKNNVWLTLQRYNINQGDVKDYQDNTKVYWDAVTQKSLAAFMKLDEAETKELLKRRGLVDAGIAYDKSSIASGNDPASKPMVTINMIGVKPADVIIDVTPESNK